MAYFEKLVGRDVGQPKSPAVPGGPPRPSMPTPFKNPPAVATGPVGRPSSPQPPFAGSAGPALPVSPQAAGPATRPSLPAPSKPTLPGQTPSKPAAPSQPATPGGVVAAPAALAAPTLAAPALSISFDRFPSKYEISQVPEGTNIQTPYGPMDRSGNIQFTPEGELKYKQAVVQRRKDFGPHPWAGDPNAPAPPARMGGWMINPFTGQWRR